ncbi:VWA domain-containing protein [Marinibaculum pumilum]|uniref:VWA domain-containing protein n=1 Tax=Marinibaculum pumilum TaxID=1766165 RepID=A0ABV7KXI1_9PROT
MQRTVGSFIEVLRTAGLPVSIPETLEAHRALDLVGYQDPATLKHAWGAVLAKSEEEQAIFETCFDRFFAPPDKAPVEGGRPRRGDRKQDEEEDDSPDNGFAPTGGQPFGGGGGSGTSELRTESQLARMLMENDRAAMTQAVEQAAEAVGLDQIRLFTQTGRFTRQIMEEIGLDGLDAEIAAQEARDDAVGGGMARALRIGRQRLFRRVGERVDRQLALKAEGESRAIREDVMSRVRLSAVDRRDYRMMAELIRKMAKKLITLHSRRRKVTDRGHLDLRRTLRRNVAHDGVLMDLHWKQKKIDRPEIFALCDVSGSVSAYARFLLMFLYSLGEVLPKVRAFAFTGPLAEVTDQFQRHDVERAVTEVINTFGFGSSDYGMALDQFAGLCMDDVDHRSTVIILGDARTNNVNPRIETLELLHRRARRVIWLNPESHGQWGTGDSAMLRYAAHCTRVESCGSLRQLERAVDNILRGAA